MPQRTPKLPLLKTFCPTPQERLSFCSNFLGTTDQLAIALDHEFGYFRWVLHTHFALLDLFLDLLCWSVNLIPYRFLYVYCWSICDSFLFPADFSTCILLWTLAFMPDRHSITFIQFIQFSCQCKHFTTLFLRFVILVCMYAFLSV